jgi:L-amino acid N-acyltransferase YncA
MSFRTHSPHRSLSVFICASSAFICGRKNASDDDWKTRLPDMTAEMTTRLAALPDAAAIAAIYNQGIAERIATFETEPRTAAQVAAQLTEKSDHFPTIVVECEGRILAFAGAGPYRSRPCYAGVAEHSVYVDPAARGRGAGRAALQALIAAYEARGFWKLVSRIFPENRASLALHERTGFRTVGTYRRHARLDGEWRDCVIVERLLGAAAAD